MEGSKEIYEQESRESREGTNEGTALRSFKPPAKALFRSLWFSDSLVQYFRFLRAYCFVEGAVDDFELLRPAELDEMHSVAGNANGQLGI